MNEEKVKDQTGDNGPEKEEDGAEQCPVQDNGSGVSAEENTNPTENKEDDKDARIAELEKENADLKDQLLRRAADFDNYRKRMLKEKQDTFDYANANLLSDLLDSLDNFDRTVEAAEKSNDVKSIADGIKMISSNLVKMLETKYNLVGYGQKGDAFNPDEHEAIGSVVNEEAKEPSLKEVYLKGYKLKDKVIRHAKVMVEMPAQ